MGALKNTRSKTPITSKFVLRIPKAQHKAIKKVAATAGVSLNQLINELVMEAIAPADDVKKKLAALVRKL